MQLIGEKVSASSDFDHFTQGFHHRAPKGSNYENFLSMAGHYGSNRPILHPSFEIQKNINQNEKSLSKQHSKISVSGNRASNEEMKSHYNQLLLKSNENRLGRNISIEEMKTNKCQSNHSPLLTKRK